MWRSTSHEKASRYQHCWAGSSRRAAAVGVLAALLLAGCSPGVGLTDDVVADADAWRPPMELAEDGWRRSRAAWSPDSPARCNPDWRFIPPDVYPTSDRLYVIWGWINERTASYHGLVEENTGDGWRTLNESDCPFPDFDARGCCARRMPGSLGDRPVVRLAGAGLTSPLAFLDGGGFAVWPETSWSMADPFFVRDDLAYGVWPGIDTKLVRFNGSDWSPVPEPVPFDLPYRLAHIVWSDGTTVLVAGERGTILSLETTGWRVHDTGTMAEITALWGFAGNDAWAANALGLLMHWDGSAWTEVDWPNEAHESSDVCGLPDSILGMWGTDGVLYLHTARQVLRHDSTGFTSLGYWPGHPTGDGTCGGGAYIFRLRGTSRDEVFLAVAEPGSRDIVSDDLFWGTDLDSGCVSRPYLLHWDGTAFHWI